MADTGVISRNTFDPSKSYERVQYVGGVGRRLFDFELNEAQQIALDREQKVVSALLGHGDYEGNVGCMIDDGGKVTPEGATNHVVHVQGGYISAAGKLVPVGTPGAQQALTVFTDVDAAALQAVVYYDVSEVTITGDDDAEIIDPTYNTYTAQRVKLNALLTVTKGTNVLPAAPAGHTYVLLAVVTNNNAILQAGDIVAGTSVRSNTRLGSSLDAVTTTANNALSTANSASTAITNHISDLSTPRHVTFLPVGNSIDVSPDVVSGGMQGKVVTHDALVASGAIDATVTMFLIYVSVTWTTQGNNTAASARIRGSSSPVFVVSTPSVKAGDTWTDSASNVNNKVTAAQGWVQCTVGQSITVETDLSGVSPYDQFSVVIRVIGFAK